MNKKYSNKRAWNINGLKTHQNELIYRYSENRDFVGVNSFDIFEINENPTLFFKANNFITNTAGELIFSYIAKFLNLDNIVVYPAIMIDEDRFDFQEGYVAENYNKDESRIKIKSLDDLYENFNYWKPQHTLEDAMERINDYAKHLKLACRPKQLIYNETKFRLFFEKLLIIDFLTYQDDRHPRNINFQLRTSENAIHLEPAKIFDSNQIFLFNSHMWDEIFQAYSHVHYKKTCKLADKYADLYFKPYDKNSNTKELTVQIARMMTQNPALKKFHSQLLNLDFEQIKYMIKQDFPNYQFNQKELEIAEMLFTHRLKNVNAQMLLLGKNQINT